MKDDDAEPRIPANALIDGPTQARVRLRGSHSSQRPTVPLPLMRRRPPEGDAPGEGEEPVPRPPPPPPVSTPDLAFQVSMCLPSDLEGEIPAAVRAAIDPNADVRSACVNGTHRIGVWLRPAVNEQDGEARARGLERLNILPAGEALTFFVNSALIRRGANDAWALAPKRLNGDGMPDPDGPIHLTGMSLSFEEPNRIVTRVDGFDERPWPDVSFRLTVSDVLSVSAGQVRCDTQRHLDTDTSWLNFLTGLFLVVFRPLGIVFLVERIIVAGVDAPDTGAGPGASAAALVPRAILIPRGLKVVMTYSRVAVSPGGMFAVGSFEVVPRTPSVAIGGPIEIPVAEGTSSVVRNYTLRIEDLRPPLQIVWSGEGVPLSPTSETTGVRFDVSGVAVGGVATRRVAVRVTDADGLVGSDEAIARIYVVPEEMDDFPPVCRAKPWLPQCAEPMARAARVSEKA